MDYIFDDNTNETVTEVDSAKTQDYAEYLRDEASYQAAMLKHEREQPFWDALDDFCEERGDDPQELQRMQIELGISNEDIENRRFQMSQQLDF